MYAARYFHKELALFLIDLCRLTYVQYKKNGEFHIPKGFQLIKQFKARSLHSQEWFGFILESPDSILIAFRGTQSDPDWVSDAQVFQRSYPYVPDSGLVHDGFLSIYESCRDEIMNVYETVPPYKKLYITGHSLGGALATLHALDARVNTDFTQVLMYNYGSPRVGDTTFKRTFRSFVPISIRFVNFYDLVPKLPPPIIKSFLLKKTIYYNHVPTPMKFAIQKESVLENHSLNTYEEGVKSFP
ncbi:lipase family protein [Pontibacillus marinus]|uniref:Lipase n=1 Tax=Pontibacillus marinus BH030004 = DSM 16465 TaxID=1385511 RepID=A0A0A5GBV8_9BACI|nr:lipase family protein [Pontibacillus marinus]KGX90671.1 lipase [Pontibacillus marinus BH030004 = DSM 16465]